MSEFRIYSPTVIAWSIALITQRALLANPKAQMEMLLDEVRLDIDSQFDEKQGEWKPLRPYTIAKKEAMDADMRILHETREGQGLRLRDAYAKAGYVDDGGRLVYTYPSEKPYAIEHQEGKTDAKADRKTTTKKRRKTMLEKRAEGLEEEFFNRFG